MQRLLQHHRAVLEQRGERRVGGDAIMQPIGGETDVMAAGDARLAAFAEARGGTQPQAQGRPSGERLHAAHEHHRPEHAPATAKPRREIDDAQCATVRVVEARLDDRGIAHVALFGAREIDHVDGEHAGRRFTALLLQQRREHRVAVGPRQARPHHARLLVDERGHLAVADDAVVHGAPVAASWPNHWRTAAGPGSHHSDLHARAHRDREAVVTPHRGESAVVGLIVADEDGLASAKRRLFHEFADRAVLGVRRGLHFDDGMAIEQGEVRHQRRGQQRHFGAQLVFELARLEEMQRQSRALVLEHQPAMARDQALQPGAHRRASCSSATGATCSAPCASRRSQPCSPASGNVGSANSRSRSAIVRPLTSATAPSAASRSRPSSKRELRVDEHRPGMIRELEQGSIHVEKQAPGDRGQRHRLHGGRFTRCELHHPRSI